MYARTDPPPLERRLAPHRGNLAPPPGMDHRPGPPPNQSVNQFQWLFLSELVLHNTRGTDLSGSLQGSGGIGGLLARTDNTQISPVHAYYNCDGKGNVTALINAQQAFVAKYLYDPFGNILSQSGLLADANLYRFSSKEYHQQSALVYYLYRFYDAKLQRWSNCDPKDESGFNCLAQPHATANHFNTLADINLYYPFSNDPVDTFDPDGRFGATGVVVIIGGAALLLTLAHLAWECHKCNKPLDEFAKAVHHCQDIESHADKNDSLEKFINQYKCDDAGCAIYKCAIAHAPDAYKDMIKECTSAAVKSYMHGLIPGLALD
jgi:RHS repeat-associated protein